MNTLNGPGFLETFQGFQRWGLRSHQRWKKQKNQHCIDPLPQNAGKTLPLEREILVIPYCDVDRDYDRADDDGEGGDHDGGEGRWKGWPASFDGASCRQVGPGPV